MRDDVSALFVRADGPYPGLVSDWWDVERDATKYDGPNPIVAHPPCKRWGRWWYTDGSDAPGNDDGLFASALESLHRFGGVLEHPEGSHGWRAFGIRTPTTGAWYRSICGLWTTCVAQRNYGHRARKLTWLLYSGDTPPAPLDWSRPKQQSAYLTAPGRHGGPGDTSVERLSHREVELTPDPFALALLDLAADCRPGRAMPIPLLAEEMGLSL